VGIDGFGADELPPTGAAALRIELHDAGLHRNSPRPRADTTIPTPGTPILQCRRHRCTAPPHIEPAASLPGPVQPGGVTASPPDGLLNLPREAGRPGADAAGTASADLRTAPVPDLAGPESKVVVIACHGMTIGSRANAHKGQPTRIVVWRRKGRSGVAAGGRAFERRRSER